MKAKLLTHVMILLALMSFPAMGMETLGEMMRSSGFDRMIGTWVDAETNGKENTTTFAWKFEDHVVEVTSRQGDKNEVSLIGRNPKTGDVFHMSADDQGGSNIGKWEASEDGSATLSVLFVTGESEEGGLSINFRFEDDDTLMVTLDLPEPLVLKLVRSKDPK